MGDWFEEARARDYDKAESWKMERPICIECGHHIQDAYMYEFDDGPVCPDCLDDYVEEHFMTEIKED